METRKSNVYHIDMIITKSKDKKRNKERKSSKKKRRYDGIDNQILILSSDILRATLITFLNIIMKEIHKEML